MNGRLEFIGGGWSMNDEATAHYISIIDQMTLGHQFLIKEFGPCGIPKIGWQIDTFGHSQEQASLFAQMNFDGLFIGRLDYNDKIKREKDLNMEFVWRGNDDLRQESNLFTVVLPNIYNPPEGFCFDDTCLDEPIIDDKNSSDFNVDRRVKEFINLINKQAQVYKTNNLIMTMGSDFQYQNAIPWFVNLDRLINLVNKANKSINLMYSTPTCYLKSLNNENITWKTKSDDFFPYSSDSQSFWAGYFTSRPSFKGFERWASGHLQSSKQLQFLAKLNKKKNFYQINQLKEALGVCQHHDAITGTEKEHVFKDYVFQLNKAIDITNQLNSNAFDILTKKIFHNINLNISKIEFCKKLNVSECNITENSDYFIMHLYNPLSSSYKYLVRIPINIDNEEVTVTSSNKTYDFDILDISEFVQKIPERSSNSSKELVFLVELNATSINNYIIKKTKKSSNKKINSTLNNSKLLDNKIVLNGLDFKLIVDNKTGLTESLILDYNTKVKFKHVYKYYKNEIKKLNQRTSGAYIFHPDGIANNYTTSKIIGLNLKSSISEIHVEISDYVKETIRVHKNLPYIEFDFLIGPIPIDDKIGKEIISVFTTNLKSNKTFYTDSNGRQYLKRIRNKRKTYNYNSTLQPISSNYYPVNNRIELKDKKKKLKLVILTDRSQGGSSLNDGELELMLSRRLLHDDGFGVNEALNETGTDGKGLIIRGIHRVFLGDFESIDYYVPRHSLKMTLPPLIAFRNLGKISKNTIINSEIKTPSILYNELSHCINLLTVELLNDFLFLIRLEHLFSSNSKSRCTHTFFELDLRNIFSDIEVQGALELTLSANQIKKENSRLEWKIVDITPFNKEYQNVNNQNLTKYYKKKLQNQTSTTFDVLNYYDTLMNKELNEFIIMLGPSQIRTFIIKFKMIYT